ncbi:MAG: DNA helicase RecQ [Acidobacteriota bacterium]
MLRGPHIASADVLSVLRRFWGYDSLRPLQARAIAAVLGRRDSVVVMPTGGGKSLCYQLPPLLTLELTVVVSPLISLMKDQVDSLRELGVEARQLNSTTSPDEKREIAALARSGALRLLFVSPERLASERLQQFLRQLDVRTFAIDEAHCISHWGHDFRPEYRQMGELRQKFPQAAFHAYTATATVRVREDIASQLSLSDPELLVGSFDRPNLTYRVLPRREKLRQALAIVEKHPGEAGIVYCITRKEVDEFSATLQRSGIAARPYHAGLSSEERSRTQEAFANEECNLVVATVAFGMGIDRSNIRFVLHTGLPKSIEHYQQETGRAGRDGLEAECVLFYSGADVLLWRTILERSNIEAGGDEEIFRAAMRHVDSMDRYARGSICRHRALVQHFGERHDGNAPCAACDICLGEIEEVGEALVISQKILSCIARAGQRFGAGQIISILRGEQTERVAALGHDRLSTFGTLSSFSHADLRDWIHQLIGQGALHQEGDRYPILTITAEGRSLLRGESAVRLVQLARKEPVRKKRRGAGREGQDWEGVDSALFEALREMRRTLAKERGVPPFVILGDRTLREIARLQPRSLTMLREVYGIGERKLTDFGSMILRIVAASSASAHGS